MQDIVKMLALPPPPQSVLVVEDFVPALELLTNLLSSAGYHVSAGLGVMDALPGRIQLVSPPDHPWIDLTSVQIAFLDYYFLGGITNGGELTQLLMAGGKTRVIGMSSSAAANETMFRYGAAWTMQKRELLQLLRS